MIDYLLLDVFTDRAYSGNPLAVVLDSDDLDGTAMQALAEELNLSETVFLGARRTDGSWPTRIFTPHVELPFAGHPTIGAAVALASTGRIPVDDGTGSCVLAEPVGVVPVEVQQRDGTTSARLTSPRHPERVAGFDRHPAARLASLEELDLHVEVDPAVWSAGVPFAVVVVRDLDALGRARPAAEAEHVYVVAPVDGTPSTATTWRARMFAPAMGIAEDPATGAAAAAFAGLLGALDPGGAARRSWTVIQGVEMGRASRLEVTVERESDGSDELTAVHVGGAALIVGSGSLVHPDGGTLGG